VSKRNIFGVFFQENRLPLIGDFKPHRRAYAKKKFYNFYWEIWALKKEAEFFYLLVGEGML
jgi:hypothetical protein